MIGSSVLIVVDVQVGFIRPPSAPVVPVIADLVCAWRKSGPTIFTRYHNYPGSLFERLVRWSEMQAGSPDVEIVPELTSEAAVANLVIDKTGYTSLTPKVLAFLEEHGITDVYVCGIATESCVLKTAVDAFEHGLTPWIITDASASHGGPGPHEAGLLVAKRFIGEGQLITVADVLARL